MSITILGAGLSGLIAATQFPRATVIERNGPEYVAHKAVLRFRSDSLSRLTGIPFRSVMVRKSIWNDGHVQPNIQLANQYSVKTNGAFLSRSIWNVEAVERFIAPEDVHSQLAGIVGNRITWNTPISDWELATLSEPIISTLPMPVLCGMIGVDVAGQDFAHSPIIVDRYRVRNADVFQTIYFPAPSYATYRASITGSLLIVERSHAMNRGELREVLNAFGMNVDDVELIEDSHSQKYGKIRAIDDVARREAIFNLTQSRGIYSLGRFAIWKNVLLDDVVNDVAVIKKLITGGKYSSTLHHHQQKG